MAVTYNFTVRALDTSGAFADRAFSLTINNTAVYRFIGTGNATGTVKSYDGITWEQDNGIIGNMVEYGNGMWLILTSSQLRRSSDGVSWDTYTPTITQGTGGPLAPTGTLALLFVKYFNNTWYMACNGSSSSNLVIASSADNGLTWSTVGSVAPVSFSVGVTNLVYNTYNGDMLISLTSPAVYRSTNGGVTWTNVTPSGLGVAQNGEQVVYANGVYFYIDASSSAVIVKRSVDGVNWNNLSVGVGAGGGGSPVYGNGIFAFASNSIAISSTSDAGNTWTNTNIGTGNSPYNSFKGLAFNYGTWVRSNGTGTALFYSRNNMSTWTSCTHPSISDIKYIGTRI